MSSICVRVVTFPWMWIFMKNPYEGAQCAIRLATDPQLKEVSGEYFNDCEVAASSEPGKDKELAKKLYMQTIKTLESVTKLTVDRETYAVEQESEPVLRLETAPETETETNQSEESELELGMEEQQPLE